MPFLSKLAKSFRTWPSGDDRWFSIVPPLDTASGKSVDEQTALQMTAVFACVKVLGETVGSLPRPLLQRLPGNSKQRATGHSLYRIVHDRPNRELTNFQYTTTTVAHMALWGNAYSFIERNNANEVIGLWPIRPDRVDVKRSKDPLPDGTFPKIFSYRPPVGERRTFLAEQMIHYWSLSLDGVKGISPIGIAREAVALGLAAEEYAARLFSNDARPGGILKHPSRLDAEAHKRMQNSWMEAHAGGKNAHKPAVLEMGVEWQQVGIPPEDAQFMQGRRYQVGEIARIYRMPLHKIQEMERATFNNIEEQNIEFKTDTIQPLTTSIEQSMTLSLLTEKEQEAYFIEHVLEGLLRGDIKSRYDAYAVGRQWGWLSANDIRRLENMNPIGPAGDVYLTPLNMIPATEGNGDSARRAQAYAELTSPEPRLLTDPVEQRAQRSAEERRRIAAAWTPKFEEAAATVVRGEVREVRKAIKRFLVQRDSAEFIQWLEEYYGEDFERFVDEHMGPVIASMSEEVRVAAAEEIDFDEVDVPPELDVFLRGYRDTVAFRWTRASRRQLQTIADQSNDPEADVEKRLVQWEAGRAAKAGRLEPVEASGAFSVQTYKRAGIRRKRWVTFGDTCPFCQQLDGRVVSIDQAFLSKGDRLEAEGQAPMVSKRVRKHPPAHDGCDCGVSAAA